MVNTDKVRIVRSRYVLSPDEMAAYKGSVICNPDLTRDYPGQAYRSLQDAIDYAHDQFVATSQRWAVLLGSGNHGNGEIKEGVGIIGLGLETSEVGTLTTNVTFTGTNFATTTVQNVIINNYQVGVGAICALKDVSISGGTCLGVFAGLGGSQASAILNMDLSNAVFVFAQDIVTENCIMPANVILNGGSHTSNEYTGLTAAGCSIGADLGPNTFNTGAYNITTLPSIINIAWFNSLGSGSELFLVNTFLGGDMDIPAGVVVDVIDCGSAGVFTLLDATSDLALRNTACIVDNSVGGSMTSSQGTLNTSNFSNLTNPGSGTRDIQEVIEEIDSLLGGASTGNFFVDSSLGSNDPSKKLYNNFDDAYDALGGRSESIQTIYIAGNVATEGAGGKSYDFKNVELRGWFGGNNDDIRPQITFAATDDISFWPSLIQNLRCVLNNTGSTCGYGSGENQTIRHINCEFQLAGSALSVTNNSEIIVYEENVRHSAGLSVVMYNNFKTAGVAGEVTVHSKNCDFSSVQSFAYFDNQSDRSKNFVWYDEGGNLYADAEMVFGLYQYTPNIISQSIGSVSNDVNSPVNITDIQFTAASSSVIADYFTVTTNVGHGYQVGDYVEIESVITATSATYNGIYRITNVPSITEFECVVEWQGSSPTYTSGGTATKKRAFKLMKGTAATNGDILSIVADMNFASNANNKTFRVVGIQDGSGERNTVDLTSLTYSGVITETQGQIETSMRINGSNVDVRGNTVFDNTIEQHTANSETIVIQTASFEMLVIIDGASNSDIAINALTLSHNKSIGL